MNGVFGLNGILGYLIAVVLLLSILAGLTIVSIGIQSSSATNPYAISGEKVAAPKTKQDVWANLQDVEMISSNPSATQSRVVDAK
jgi:hypothetical protein